MFIQVKHIAASLAFVAAASVSMVGASAHANVWKSVFVAGDDSIPNFDNGREDLAAMFSAIGTVEANHFTSAPSIATGGVKLATHKNLGDTFSKLNVQADQGCLVHMTSHGIKNGGFYLSRSQPLLPAQFAQMVNAACGDQPTVIMVSACYSGQFITDELKGDNRIILTAAIADRPSFGCPTDTEYTYWDECLLEGVPVSKNWNEVYTNTTACVQKKEAAIGARPSLPQAFFGKNTNGWVILE